jgi:hypothetical protein
LMIDFTHKSKAGQKVHLRNDCPGLKAAYSRSVTCTEVCLFCKKDFRRDLFLAAEALRERFG